MLIKVSDWRFRKPEVEVYLGQWNTEAIIGNLPRDVTREVKTEGLTIGSPARGSLRESLAR